MNSGGGQQREDVLIGLMADYDAALAEGMPTDRINDTAADIDPQLDAEWQGVKECLELLERARRSGVAGSGPQESGLDDPASGNALNDEAQRTNDAYCDLRHSNAAVSALGRQRLGRFVLERELGRGGLGIVYLAHDPRLGRKVALKIPRLEALLNVDLRRRFLREAEAVARLNHPHLVALYEAGEDRSICYLASEYCPGPTLAQWLRARTAPVSYAEAVHIVSALAEAVEHAHSRGVLHRDIKPSNVLLDEGVACPTSDARESKAESSPRRSPKLTDFGMAKLLEQDDGDRTRTGAVVGTLAYMAPEQLEGRTDALDARTDIYALGTILYELLTGRTPYRGSTEVEVVRQLFTGEPTRPRTLRPDVPRDLEAVTMKCLARRPCDRYASAGDLAADLTRFREHRPTVARPLGVTARAAKWTRRRPAFAAICVLSLVAAAVAAGINARRIEDVGRARDESKRIQSLADQERRRAAVERSTSRRLLYASRMRKAQQAWRDGNVKLLGETLDFYSDGTPEAGLRHFEWYHLNHLLHVPHRVLEGHKGRVYAVAYSPAGRVIVSGAQDGTLRFWDAASGDLLDERSAHQGDINTVAFAAGGDTFVTAGDDKTIKLWSLDRRTSTGVFSGHTQPVDGCMFLDGGRLLGSLSAAVGGRRELLVWDVATARPWPNWLSTEEQLRSATAAPLGRTSVTFAGDQAIVWKSSGDTWVDVNRFPHPDPRPGAIVSPDEEHLLTPVWPRFLHVIRLRDGVTVNVLRDHGAGVNCIAFSPTGDRIATASDDESVCVFEYPSGKLEHRFFGHYGGSVWQVAWSPTGNTLASVGNDGMVRLWDLQQGSVRRQLLLPPDSPISADDVWGLAYLQNGQQVNLIDRSGRSFTWKISAGSPTTPVESPQTPVPVSSDSATSTAVDSHAPVSQWDIQAYSIPNRFQISNRELVGINSCTRLIDGGSQIIEIEDGRWRTRNTRSWRESGKSPTDSERALKIVFDISSDGAWLCGKDEEGHVVIHDCAQATNIRLDHFHSVRLATFSPQGDRVLVVSGDGVLEYDVDTGRRIRRLSHELATAASYSADAQRIAVAFEAGYVSNYDAITGEETLQLDRGASAIVFARDGTSLLTVDRQDGSPYLWLGSKVPGL